MKDLSFLKSNLIAHRGIYDNNKVYENTIKAFDIAIKNNYIIEFDVRLLKDGIIVVFHDEDMSRLQKVDDKLKNITYGDIKYYSKFEIPTLKEVLEFVNGRVPIIIDIKGKSKKNKLEKDVLAFLSQYEGEVALQSFDESTVKWLYKNAKEYPVGLLMSKPDFFKEYFFRKYDFLNIKVNVFNDKRIRVLREKETVIGYGIKDKKMLKEKRSVYDNLICDNLLEIDTD